MSASETSIVYGFTIQNSGIFRRIQAENRVVHEVGVLDIPEWTTLLTIGVFSARPTATSDGYAMSDRVNSPAYTGLPEGLFPKNEKVSSHERMQV
jgi:hypothetical protein